MLKFEKKKIHKGRGKKGGEKAKTILINAGKFPPEISMRTTIFFSLLKYKLIITNNNK